jgi:hypothetical protein
MGATVVTTAVTGHDEYVVHGENGLVVGWDDVHGTARALDLLARDRRLLHELRTGALRTARAWPDWRQASQLMALALRRVAAEPPPPVRGAGLRLASEFATVKSEAQVMQRRIEDEHRARMSIYDQRAWKAVVAVRREVYRGRTLKQRAAGRVKRMLRR